MDVAVVCFSALWDNFLSFKKKIHPFLCIPIFYNFCTIFNDKKSLIRINTYTLTLNKNPILMYTYF